MNIPTDFWYLIGVSILILAIAHALPKVSKFFEGW